MLLLSLFLSGLGLFGLLLGLGHGLLLSLLLGLRFGLRLLLGLNLLSSLGLLLGLGLFVVPRDCGIVVTVAATHQRQTGGADSGAAGSCEQTAA